MSAAWLSEEGPRIGRLNFFLANLGLGVLMAIAVTWFGPDSSLFWVLGLAVMCAGFVLDVMRLRSIGVSQWFAMLRFVPYVHLLYTILLQSAQAGWTETRTLDSTGRTLLIVQIALLILMIFMLTRTELEDLTFMY